MDPRTPQNFKRVGVTAAATMANGRDCCIRCVQNQAFLVPDVEEAALNETAISNRDARLLLSPGKKKATRVSDGLLSRKLRVY
jgi:hypothetical protein